MVKLLIGRAGTGKSEAILRAMTGPGEGQRILIVPEQYSHQAERRLCAVGGNTASLRAEVLTFTRLASRVFSAVGGVAHPVLDGGGRLLAMYQAVRRVAPGLSVYRHPSRKPAFLTGLLTTLDECKSYQVTPDTLREAGETMGGAGGDKLADLGLIFTVYETLCETVGADPRDKLTRLADGLRRSRWAAGLDIYLDCFTDFTPQEGLVISALMSTARSVTVALTCDHLEEDEDGQGIFSPARRTAAYLERLARQAGQRLEVETRLTPRPGKAEALYHLERELFAPRPARWAGAAPVTLGRAATPRREVEWACAAILRLVREEGYRFRDIAVAARDFSLYEDLCAALFPQYGIPLFLSHTQDILQKPVLTLITAALDACAGDYRYEDIFRYLKTGLSGVSADEVDRLENYALTWEIKGGRWFTDTPWHMHPDGLGGKFTPGDEEAVAALDALRRRIIEPLEGLRRRKAATGREWAMALYDFLEAIHLPETLSDRVALLRERGELNLAEETAQLWDILTGALEQCAQLLAEEEMGLEEWARLFPLVLSQYQVSAIPVALDRVTAGPVTRFGYQTYRALLFLGCDEDHVPLRAPSAGLLNDADRAALAQLGVTVAPRLEDKLRREMTICYTACALPTERLFVTYAAKGGGEDMEPSFLLKRLALLFPDVPLVDLSSLPDPRLAAAGPALELAAEWPALREALEKGGQGEALGRLRAALAVDRGSLSPDGVAALYGRQVPMSASRLDRYRTCHFAYFMRYGLGAKPRAKSGLDAPRYGTFVHAVLEEVLRRWTPESAPEAVRDLTREAMDRYLREELGGLEDKSPRFAYLFRHLTGTVERVVENVTAELSRSDFKPLAFELGFGKKGELPPVELTVDGVTVSLSGFVDRVDGWERDGKLYLRVVDYKTGEKPFDLTDIFHGMGLQLLLYLFTLEDEGEGLFGKPVVPAGALYLPAREVPVVGPRDMPEEARQEAVDKALLRQGLLLDDPQVLCAMERPEGERRFLPFRVTKEGTFSGESLVSLERLGRLSRHVRRVLEEVGRELAAGTVTADPFWRGPMKNACLRCEYRAACQFWEGKGGDHRRHQRHMGAKHFWAQLEGGEEDGLSADG